MLDKHTSASLALIALMAAAACSRPAPAVETPASAASPRDGIELTDAAMKHAGIAVESAQTKTTADQILTPGSLALDETRTARIGSLHEGLVLRTLAQVGDRVRARQLLATMHGHALHDAWAGYRKAIAERRRAEKELAYAADAHERAKRLFADKAVSLQDVQRAEVERASATQAVEIAAAEVSRSIQELEHVGVSPDDGAPDTHGDEEENSSEQIPIRSPLAGAVLERLVTPGTTVTPGSPLFVVSDLSTLWAVAEIDEARLPFLRVGRSVDVLVAAYPDERFTGTITMIGDVINPKTRRVTVRSTIPNRDGRLKPDMFATIVLGQSDSRSIVVVARAAIQTIDGRTTVFVNDAEGRFTPRAVELGPENGDVVEIRNGLRAGERVVVTGSFVLKSELLKNADGGGQ